MTPGSFAAHRVHLAHHHHSSCKLTALWQVQVVHQFAKHGTRYAVDYDVDTSIMEQELVGGRALAIDYVQKSGGDSSTLRQSSVRWRSEEIVDHGMGSKDFQQNLTLDWDNLISTQKLPNLPVQ